jgi:hypothetical protein
MTNFGVTANAEQAVGNCYYINPPAKCDLCERAFEQEDYFVDGHVKGVAACAFMCADCFAAHSARLGLGIGQLYMRERDGRWWLVAGWPR